MHRRFMFPLIFVLSLLISANNYLFADEDTKPSPKTRSGEQINWQVISGGGTNASSTTYKLSATVGQTADSEGASSIYKLKHGFWQEFGEAVCDCQPGEADGLTSMNILDIVYVINYVYKGGPEPVPYAECSADADCDCTINILDIVYVINNIYKGGPAPCACESWVSTCGPLH